MEIKPDGEGFLLVKTAYTEKEERKKEKRRRRGRGLHGCARKANLARLPLKIATTKKGRERMRGKTSAVLIGAVAALVVGWLALSLYDDDSVPTPPCPPLHHLDDAFQTRKFSEIPFHCFFVRNYDESRERFREAVGHAGGQLTTEPIGYEDLTIDFGVFLPSGQTFDNLLLHFSGTHGVEALAGSAIQLAALEYLSSSSPPLSTAIVFVHSVNPYGFKYLRRVNENNVDLNRNFLDEDGWKEALSRSDDFAGYASMSHHLNPTHPPTRVMFLNDVIFWIQNIASLLQNGIGKIKKAIVAGNYHDPRGIGFGGRQSQPSVQAIERFLTTRGLHPSVFSLPPPCSSFMLSSVAYLLPRLYIMCTFVNRFFLLGFNKVNGGLVFIDVHTGLGASGVDTMMEGGRSTAEVK
jgi:hypothetical protein